MPQGLALNEKDWAVCHSHCKHGRPLQLIGSDNIRDHFRMKRQCEADRRHRPVALPSAMAAGGPVALPRADRGIKAFFINRLSDTDRLYRFNEMATKAQITCSCFTAVDKDDVDIFGVLRTGSLYSCGKGSLQFQQ